MSDHPKVAIFWDYENCSPPSNSYGLGYDLVNNVGRIARVFGSVTTFKAYLDISTQSPKSVVLRSELQSSGVSMIDCPHNGRKDVVDKMILVDMITFAVDHPAPATIILIAGDRDYAYAVSTLRLRKYKVILIVPSSPHIPACLESQASLVIDWSTAVLRTRTESTNASIRQPYLDLDADLVTKLEREVVGLLNKSDTTAYSTTSAPCALKRRRVSASDLLEPSEFMNSIKPDSFDSALEPKHSYAPPETLKKSGGTTSESTPHSMSVPRTLPRPRCASVSAPAPTPGRARSATTVTPSTLNADKQSLVCPVGNTQAPAVGRLGIPDIPTSGLAEPDLLASPSLDAHLGLPSHYDGPPSSIIIRSPLEQEQSTDDMPRSGPQPVPQAKHGLNCLASPFTMTETLLGGMPASCSNPSQEPVMTAAPAPPVITHEKPGSEGGFTTETARPEDKLGIPNEAELMEALGLDDDDEGTEQFLPCPADLDVTSDAGIFNNVDASMSNRHTHAVQEATHVAPSGEVDLDTASSQGVPPVTVPISVASSPATGPSDESILGKSAAPSCTSDSMADSPRATMSVPSTDAKPSIPLPTAADPCDAGSPHEAARQQTYTKFQLLIHLLLAARENGVTHPTRSVVAVNLVKADKQVYRRVGTSRFRDYIALAEEAGLVELGGREGNAWIALHPSWFDEGSKRSPQSDSSSSVPSSMSDSPKATQNPSPTSCTSSPVERAASPLSAASTSPSSSSLESNDNSSPADAYHHASQDSIPARFQPLIDTLLYMRDKGHYHTLRSLVGLSLSDEVYARAGVSGFRDYILHASEAGLVECGGIGGHAWIRIHPTLRV
ncbi:DUF537-domain-containing protein [Paxillus ammoniavirescens]|nr:DUF537-domain-containing protein [Paxillus ammoniavirescens]